VGDHTAEERDPPQDLPVVGEVLKRSVCVCVCVCARDGVLPGTAAVAGRRRGAAADATAARRVCLCGPLPITLGLHASPSGHT